METLEIALWILGWLLIGWLFANLKVRYWYNFLIKKEYASKYYKFSSDDVPIKIFLPIFLIWPIQTFGWLASGYKDHQKEAMPITPLGCYLSFYERTIRSNINFAILSGQSTYWRNYENTNQEIDKEEHIRMQFGLCTLAGGFHLLFWGLGILLCIFLLTLFFYSSAIKWIARLISFTSPSIGK